MALSYFRRHTGKCTKGYAPSERKIDCRCRFSVEGKLNGEYIRESSGTRSLERVKALIKRAEETGRWEKPREKKPHRSAKDVEIGDALQKFLAHCESPGGANLAQATIDKYRYCIYRLKLWCDQEGYSLVREIDKQVLLDYKDSWAELEQPVAPSTTANYITCLKVFGEFCLERDFWPKNYCRELKNPRKAFAKRNQPFSDSQMEQLLEAARTIEFDVQQPVDNFIAETFILMMRRTGMAICDAGMFHEDELDGDIVRYIRRTTERNENAVQSVVPLPSLLYARLLKIKQEYGLNKGYYFCYGKPNLKTVVSGWHKRMRQVFEKAGMSRTETHRFRHTFAAKLLGQKIKCSDGQYRWMPLDKVARMLGHANEATTLRYYKHFIKEREEDDIDMMRAYNRQIEKEQLTFYNFDRSA